MNTVALRLLEPGLTILSGRESTIRARLTVQLAMGEQSYGDILYFSTERMFQQMEALVDDLERQRVVGAPTIAWKPSCVLVARQFDERHVALIERWLATTPQPQLIVIDPLRVRAKADAYEQTLAATLRSLQNLVQHAKRPELRILATTRRSAQVTPRVLTLSDQLLSLVEEPDQLLLYNFSDKSEFGKEILRSVGNDQWMPTG